MKRVFVWLGLGAMVFVACNDSLGPAIHGRWATTGIELIANAETRELHVACNRPARIPWAARLDDNGRFEFSGTLGNSMTSYDFTFSGQIRGDTLAVTMSSNVAGGPTFTRDYLMTADGDPAFDRLMCIG
jgi:hypothetical protein